MLVCAYVLRLRMDRACANLLFWPDFAAGQLMQIPTESAESIPFDLTAYSMEMEEHFKNFKLDQSAYTAIKMVGDLNEYIQTKAPWKLPKSSDYDGARNEIIRTCLEGLYVSCPRVGVWACARSKHRARCHCGACCAMHLVVSVRFNWQPNPPTLTRSRCCGCRYIAAHFLEPFMPTICGKVFDSLGTPPQSIVGLSKNFDNLAPGTPVTVGEILFAKIEMEAKE